MFDSTTSLPPRDGADVDADVLASSSAKAEGKARANGNGAGDDDDDDLEDGEEIELAQLLKDRDRRRSRSTRPDRDSLDTEHGPRTPLSGRFGKQHAEADDDDEEDDPMDLVSKAVPETDDPTLPALTIRVVLIGSVLCVMGAAVSQLFFYKSNSPSFSSYFVILVSLPIGRWLARVTPHYMLHIPFFGSIPLNPGPFSIK